MSTVEIFDSRSLRGRPVTTARFITAVKYCFHDYVNVPETVYAKPWQVSILRGMYLEPLSGAADKRRVEFSTGSANSMFALVGNLRVRDQLYPWILSSVYTFAYFVFDRYKSNSRCKEAYKCMRKGTTPNIKTIRHIVNYVICNYGDKYAVENQKNREGLTKEEIDNFMELLKSRTCREELKAFMRRPKRFFQKSYRNMEDEMCVYFKLFEINSKIPSTSFKSSSKTTKVEPKEKTRKKNRTLTESLSIDCTEDYRCSDSTVCMCSDSDCTCSDSDDCTSSDSDDKELQSVFYKRQTVTGWKRKKQNESKGKKKIKINEKSCVADCNGSSSSINSNACRARKRNAEDRQIEVKACNVVLHRSCTTTKKLDVKNILTNKTEEKSSSKSTSKNKTPSNTAGANLFSQESIEVILLDDDLSENSHGESTDKIATPKTSKSSLNQEPSLQPEQSKDTGDNSSTKPSYIRVRSIAELQNMKVHLCSTCDQSFYSLAAYERHIMQHSCIYARQNEVRRTSVTSPIQTVTAPMISQTNEALGMNPFNPVDQFNHPQVQQQWEQNPWHQNYWFVSCNGGNDNLSVPRENSFSAHSKY